MVTLEAQQLAKVQQAVKHIQNGVVKVLAPAINRALASGQTTVRREIRKEYLIKQKDIPTKVHRARYANLTGHIAIQDGMLDATKFVYRPKTITRGKRQRPLFVQVKKSGGGIIARGFNSSAGPLQRRSFAPRLPVRKILVIGAPIMAGQPQVSAAAMKAIGDTLDKRIDHEIERVRASAVKQK